MQWDVSEGCCSDVPSGLFCKPDGLNFTEKQDMGNVNKGCERFRFISGADEMALSCEMGLYFDFKNNGEGFPTGCPGLAALENSVVSGVNGQRSDPQCGPQNLSLPASDHSTAWYMKHYATNQNAWLADFAAAFDKMMSNGYTELQKTELIEINCTTPNGFCQCWKQEDTLESSTEYFIESELDGRVIEQNCATTKTEMRSREAENSWQRWKLLLSPASLQWKQLRNVGSGELLEVQGLANFEETSKLYCANSSSIEIFVISSNTFSCF